MTARPCNWICNRTTADFARVAELRHAPADHSADRFQRVAKLPVTPTARHLGPSNSMLEPCPTTPQDYPENSGFAPRRERECGHRRHCADANRRPTHAHLHHWQ
jgi:hypothetical protein